MRRIKRILENLLFLTVGGLMLLTYAGHNIPEIARPILQPSANTYLYMGCICIGAALINRKF